MSVTVVRGGLDESRHLVHVAVCRADGALVASAGDPFRLTTIRSAAKPLQVEPLLRMGGADALGWDEGLLAVACASHRGEPMHTEAVRRGFGLAGLDPELLRNAAGDVEARLAHNCSGNHLGFLTLSSLEGWPLEGYRAAHHPSQQAALWTMSEALGRAPETIPTCPDGCGVLAFALPLAEIAWLYARLDALVPRQAAAMRSHPAMVAGVGEFDTVLMGALPGCVSKGGAEALQTVSLPGEGLGVAVRVEDGGFRALDPAAVSVLAQLLGWQALPGPLERFARPDLLSAAGEVVGQLRADVRLTGQSATGV